MRGFERREVGWEMLPYGAVRAAARRAERAVDALTLFLPPHDDASPSLMRHNELNKSSLPAR